MANILGTPTLDPKGAFLSALLTAASKLHQDAQTVGCGRANHLDGIFSFLEDAPKNPTNEFQSTLENIAAALVKGEKLLTHNSGSFNARFDSGQPTDALMSLERIVKAAGFSVQIMVVGFLQFENEHALFSTALEKMKEIGAAPQREKGNFRVMTSSIEEMNALVESLRAEGIAVSNARNKYPSLVNLSSMRAE